MQGEAAPTQSYQKSSHMEAQKRPKQATSSHWSLFTDHVFLTPDIETHHYAGSGTEEDPFVLEFIAHDGGNPQHWKAWKKWLITMTMAFATLAVALVSSA
jgi:hypothetical protein